MLKPEQDVWLPHGANPVLVHGRADSVPTPVVREHEGVGPCHLRRARKRYQVGGLHSSAPEGRHKRSAGVPSMLSALQRPPQCCAADIQQGGNFVGCFAAALDELASMINLGNAEFVLRAELHASFLRRLLSRFGTFDN